MIKNPYDPGLAVDKVLSKSYEVVKEVYLLLPALKQLLTDDRIQVITSHIDDVLRINELIEAYISTQNKAEETLKEQERIVSAAGDLAIATDKLAQKLRDSVQELNEKVDRAHQLADDTLYAVTAHQSQADYTETNESAPSFIRHKPDLSVYITEVNATNKIQDLNTKLTQLVQSTKTLLTENLNTAKRDLTSSWASALTTKASELTRTLESTKASLEEEVESVQRSVELLSQSLEPNFDQLRQEMTWDNLKNKPEAFEPESHTHPVSEITDLTTTLTPYAKKQELSSLITKTSNRGNTAGYEQAVEHTGTTLNLTLNSSDITYWRSSGALTINVTSGSVLDSSNKLVYLSNSATGTTLTVNNATWVTPPPTWGNTQDRHLWLLFQWGAGRVIVSVIWLEK